MRHILHIITKTDDALAKVISEKEASEGTVKCEIFDLTKSDASYEELVEKIFAADSVQVW
jgi:hypothetical protein